MKDPLLSTKISGAIILSLLVLMLVNFATDMIFDDKHGDGHAQAFAYPIEGDEGTAAGNGQEAVVVDFATLLANADVGRGEKLMRRCTSCHTFNSGGANKIGPNLYGIVGTVSGQNESFSYSSAMRNLNRTWGYDELDAFLEKPSRAVPGTKMSFGGMKKAEDRANIIRWMADQSDTPAPPLPPIQ
ncbi:MAG: cytochrome c family protein [Alphaproteobacteria bacterium]|nr:cytochrome c family protein [Alphaproteobacteria bacterium]